jgi:hypothetical protein
VWGIGFSQGSDGSSGFSQVHKSSLFGLTVHWREGRSLFESFARAGSLNSFWSGFRTAFLHVGIPAGLIGGNFLHVFPDWIVFTICVFQLRFGAFQKSE